MNELDRWLRRITGAGLLLGGILLMTGMLLLIGNILGRFVHFVIPGSYEIFELIMAVPVAFGLVFAALHKGHVVVDLVVSRFSRKTKAAAEAFSMLLSIITWALIAYAGAMLTFENGLKEISDTLSIPYLPFRLVWVLSLLLFCLAYLLDFTRAVRRLFNR